jgi:hypothetical protein
MNAKNKSVPFFHIFISQPNGCGWEKLHKEGWKQPPAGFGEETSILKHRLSSLSIFLDILYWSKADNFLGFKGKSLNRP